jgi:lipopolysaccharide export system protein LptC
VLRHSRMVYTMRLALPILAAILLAALVLWSKLGLDGDRFTLALTTIGPQKIESMTMTNPHYQGLDEKKEPFSITAKTATQIDKKGDLMALTAPQADITLEDGAWLTLNSETGRLQRGDKPFLDLNGVVNIFQDQGYEMHTRDIHIDLITKIATGHQPVAGQGPQGNLTAAGGIQVINRGKRVLLFGRSHVVLFANDQLTAAVPIP